MHIDYIGRWKVDSLFVMCCLEVMGAQQLVLRFPLCVSLLAIFLLPFNPDVSCIHLTVLSCRGRTLATMSEPHSPSPLGGLPTAQSIPPPPPTTPPPTILPPVPPTPAQPPQDYLLFELRDISKKVEDLHNKANELWNDNVELRKYIGLLDEVIHGQGSEIAGLNSQLSDQDDRILRLDNQIADHRRRASDARHDARLTLHLRDYDFAWASAAFDHQSKQISELEPKAAANTRQVITLRNRISATTKELDDVKHKLSVQHAEKERQIKKMDMELQKEKTDRTEEVANLSQTLQDEQTKNAKWTELFVRLQENDRKVAADFQTREDVYKEAEKLTPGKPEPARSGMPARHELPSPPGTSTKEDRRDSDGSIATAPSEKSEVGDLFEGMNGRRRDSAATATINSSTAASRDPRRPNRPEPSRKRNRSPARYYDHYYDTYYDDPYDERYYDRYDDRYDDRYSPSRQPRVDPLPGRSYSRR
jgi:hypothetical protein